MTSPPGANVRAREDEDNQHPGSISPGARQQQQGSANNSDGTQQRVVQREDGQFIVQNSPYGAKRSSLGWGDIFKQPPKCYDLVNHPSVYIGISSLNGVPGKNREMAELLKLYQKKFRVLEHCAPYHRMNEIETWRKWKEMAAKDFIFTVKANQYLTHIKQLEVDDDTTAHIKNFFDDRCTALGEKLGPVLIQLPPTFRNTPTHLARIPQVAALIPPHVKIAVEFRHPSWFTDDVYRVLGQCKWGLVATHNFDVGNGPVVDTGAGFLYCRLHGQVGQYTGDYGRDAMAAWAAQMRRFLENNLPINPDAKVFVFLNNNESHVSQLTSSIVDTTALAEEFFKGGPVKVEKRAAVGGNNNAADPILV